VAELLLESFVVLERWTLHSNIIEIMELDVSGINCEFVLLVRFELINFEDILERGLSVALELFPETSFLFDFAQICG